MFLEKGHRVILHSPHIFDMYAIWLLLCENEPNLLLQSFWLHCVIRWSKRMNVRGLEAILYDDNACMDNIISNVMTVQSAVKI